MRFADLILRAALLAMLRCVSWSVPSTQREDWYCEWAGELSHARRACAPAHALSWRAVRTLTSFCLGSFQDAVCLRRMERTEPIASVLEAGSAGTCILWLSAVVALCAVIACHLPGVRNQDDAARHSPRAGVLLIENSANGLISFRAYRNWNSVRQQFFTNLAFYWTEHLHANRAANGRREWLFAHASSDLFDVVGVHPVTSSANEGDNAGLPRALLSRSCWREDFNSNPAAIGAAAWVAGRHVWIVGIAPDDAWRLPEKPDLWILESDSQLARESERASGYIIAHLSSEGRGMMMGNAVRISAFASKGNEIDLFGTILAVPASGTFSIYLFALLLAMLAMPAVTSVFQSESEFAAHRPSFKIRTRGWLFLGAKCGLVAALGYFGATDIAYCGIAGHSSSAELLQIVGSFSICLTGLRWAVLDQSRRCPVCLRMVTHPAQVGIASCNFLGWNGTEMVCMGGHALLHVPNLPTSWFSCPRWTYLDKSWDFLFATAAGRL